MNASTLGQLAPFIGLPASTLRGISACATTERVRGGRLVCEDGQFLDDLSVIVDGQVSVEQDGRRVASLGAGECFGREVHLPEAHRHVSMRAASDLTLVSFQLLDLKALTSKDTQLSWRLGRLQGIAA